MSAWRNERVSTKRKECMQPRDNDVMKIRAVIIFIIVQVVSKEYTSRRSTDMANALDRAVRCNLTAVSSYSFFDTPLVTDICRDGSVCRPFQCSPS